MGKIPQARENSRVTGRPTTAAGRMAHGAVSPVARHLSCHSTCRDVADSSSRVWGEHRPSLCGPATISSNGREERHMKTMKAVVFKGKNHIAVEEVPRPIPRAGEAVIRITTTTICGTDVHI